MEQPRPALIEEQDGVTLADLDDGSDGEVAYFWKVSPLDLFDRTLDEVLEMKSQLNRLSKLITDIRI